MRNASFGNQGTYALQGPGNFEYGALLAEGAAVEFFNGRRPPASIRPDVAVEGGEGRKLLITGGVKIVEEQGVDPSAPSSLLETDAGLVDLGAIALTRRIPCQLSKSSDLALLEATGGPPPNLAPLQVIISSFGLITDGFKRRASLRRLEPDGMSPFDHQWFR